MDAEQTLKIFNDQFHICNDILNVKAKEYATEDRLHNFKRAAELQQVTTRQALAGIMVKHTVSIYDMCRSPNDYPLEVWNEKITDHLNYLLLLKVVVIEEQTLTDKDPLDAEKDDHVRGLQRSDDH